MFYHSNQYQVFFFYNIIIYDRSLANSANGTSPFDYDTDVNKVVVIRIYNWFVYKFLWANTDNATYHLTSAKNCNEIKKIFLIASTKNY